MPQPILSLRAGALQGRFVSLEPYAPDLKSEVAAALDCDPQAWSLFASSGQGDHFDGWWSGSLEEMGEGKRIAYAIRTLADGRVVGSTSFLNIRPARGVVEIGSTFLHPDVRSSPVNPEAKLLMLERAFAEGALRVELVTDLRNQRSQAAIAKLGAVREGVLRRDRVTWTGHVRDTVMFSITDMDWPSLRPGLSARVAAFADAGAAGA